MVLGFGFILLAALLWVAGFTGRTVPQVIRGELGRTGQGMAGFTLGDINVPTLNFAEAPTTAPTSGGGNSLSPVALKSGRGMTPKQVIDQIVIPIAQECGISVTPASVAAANARHGPTISGTRSDHQGPPEERWAADMSDGQSPTPGMNRLAAMLGQAFGVRINSKAEVIRTISWQGFRIQVLYRTDTGGNHFNHVHCGVST